MNFKELKAKLILLTKRNISQVDIAKALNIGRSNITLKIKNNAQVTWDEQYKIEDYFLLGRGALTADKTTSGCQGQIIELDGNIVRIKVRKNQKVLIEYEE